MSAINQDIMEKIAITYMKLNATKDSTPLDLLSLYEKAITDISGHESQKSCEHVNSEDWSL